MKTYQLILLCLLLSLIAFNTSAKQPPHPVNQQVKLHIQHATIYHPVADIKHYYVSEKLDGIRGYWNGTQLLTRQGNLINSPSWFTDSWPNYPIDGELWLAREKFQLLLSCVRKKVPNEDKKTSCWQNIRFMMFDLPSHPGKFSERVLKMRTLIAQPHSIYLAMIKQEKLRTLTKLNKKLDEIIRKHGEGLMLHHSNAYYQTGRNPWLMKLKKYQDAEAIIIGYSEGKGKYLNQLGAIKVKTNEGIIFNIGSGFSDEQRANPPTLGTIITFKFNGFTNAGIPRFARFWRVKSTNNSVEHELNEKK